jgi:cytochrome c-type biogenesis protein CcmF
VVDGRKITYLRPTVAVDSDKLTFGSVLRVERDGRRVALLHPSRRYFRPTGSEGGGTIGSFFDGEATSEVGLQAGLGSDLWIAPQPDLGAVQRRARAADAGFKACVSGAPGTPPQCRALATLMRGAAANPSLRPAALAQIGRIQTATAERIARSYTRDGAPVTFKVIVDPLVTWIWIGGLLALVGASIALWPSRPRRRGALVRTEADALKEAKYREIRDAELDHAAGKLSDQDFALLDAELRREALEILDAAGNGKAVAAGNGNGAKPRDKVPQG